MSQLKVTGVSICRRSLPTSKQENLKYDKPCQRWAFLSAMMDDKIKSHLFSHYNISATAHFLSNWRVNSLFCKQLIEINEKTYIYIER
jgi:hypothetical protein